MKSALWFGVLLFTTVLTGCLFDNPPADETVGKEDLSVMPAAVPVVSQEEANDLIQSMNREREESEKRGFVFYEEKFSSAKNVSPQIKIQQTKNWKLISKDDFANNNSVAEKQDCFIVNSETPLEYYFIMPLIENTIYKYTLCCKVKGDGRVILSRKDGKASKKHLINSEDFETFTCELGDGSSLDTEIIPIITLQGNLQIESLTIYQKQVNDQWTICLGTIEDISKVPDIEKSDYPDCFYTAKFVIKDILDGKPAPQTIQLLIPAFLDNKIHPLSKIMRKRDWKISIRPFALATKEEQEIEQVDEIETYLYTPYILVAAQTSKTPDVSASGIPILEGKPYVSPFDNPVNPPLPDKFITDSQKEIEKELEKINRIIEQVDNEDRINDEFQSVWSEKQKKYNSLNSAMIWAREQDSFFALPKKWKFIPSARITEEKVDALAELNRFFQSQGIQFIIQIVPNINDIAALVLNPDFQKYGDQRSARVVKQLLDRGIEAHYISDELVQKAFNYELLFFYPVNNLHPHEGTTDIMTTLMAHRLEQFGDIVPKDLDPALFSRENRNTGFNDNLKWPNNVDIGSHDANSIVQVPYVLYNKKMMEGNPESKVLVFGNSMTQEPMTKNAYISYLAPKIKHICSCRAMGGVSGLTTLPQLFLSSPESFLKNKQVAIFPIPILYLTNDKYTLSNVVHVDKRLRESNHSKFLMDLPLKQTDAPVFFYSFDFNFVHISTYLPSRTSSIALLRGHPKVTLPIPEGVVANKVRFSIQPLSGYGVSIKVNGAPCRLPSHYNPQWEILEFELKKTDRDISIEMDFDNCSSPDAKVLIGNVSLFE